MTFRGLYLFNHQDKVFTMVIPDSGNNELKDINKIKCVSTDKNGTVWIGTDGEGLLRWNDITNKPEKIEIRPMGKYKDSFNVVSTILTDKNGLVWSYGNGTFSNYDPVDKCVKTYVFIHKNRTVYESPGSEVIIDQAFQYDDGTIWFLNKLAGLMFRFDPGTEKLTLFRVPAFYIYQCIMDKTGSFWFACIRNNIYRLVTEKIPYLTVPVKNSSHVANIHRGTFLEDNQNRIYFLFLPGIYICKNFDVSSSIILDQFSFPDGDTIAGGGFKDSQGNLWFSNKKGNISRYNPLTRELTNLTHQSSPDYTEVVFVPLIREDKTGNIWVATSKGLFRVNIKNEKLDHILDFIDKTGDQDLIILEDFLIDSQGNFWILTSESILSIRMAEMKIIDYTGYGDGIFAALCSNIRIREDSQGNLFILNTRYGAYQFNRQNESFGKVDITKEESGSEYYDMLIDKNDRLWVAHNRGITIYDSRNKSSRLIKMPKLQFDVQSCQIKSGHILFLNNDQLYIFNENVPLNEYMPQVYLTRLLINGTDYNKIFAGDNEVSSLKEMVLPYKLNTLSIEFAALNYLNPERNQYRYFMEGIDRDTALFGQGISAEYKNMPPGHYRFWITGSNNDGLWNPSGVTLDIRILHPWYRSIIAYIVYSFCVLFLTGAYIRIRTRHLGRDKLRLEAEVKVRTAELEQANRQLAEVDRIKTHFFTDISHEIRTPLSLILGPLEHISKDEMLSSRMSVMVEIMKRNAQRLMHLINQLLDISRLDAGRMKITLTEDDIVKCLRILIYEFLSFAESKNIKYVAEIPEKSFKTWFDREKIEKITSNLLSNAFKYTPKNGTVQCFISIEAGKNDIPGSFLHIRVTDTGTGISKEHQKRIFDRFYRVEEQHEKAGHGTGIGLSLVREFVSLLHGEIKVDSIPGKGSDFSAILPLGKDHLSEEEYVITQPASFMSDQELTFLIGRRYEPGLIKKVEKGKMMILLIEDSADLRNFIKESLSNDYVILEADNGKSGINTAFTMMPDIIITDIMMPDLDGISLCNQLKNDERTSHIPIIILTAKTTSEDRITGLEVGADDYIVKPFNMAELSARITNLLIIRDKLKLKYSKFYSLESDKEISGSVDDKFMGKVMRIINTTLHDYTFDVAALVDQLGMSRSHLTRKLKILTGLSPGTLIKNIRLEKAAGLLLAKKGNITQIANSVGISNPSNFTKSFRKYFGVSPKDYGKH